MYVWAHPPVNIRASARPTARPVAIPPLPRRRQHLGPTKNVVLIADDVKDMRDLYGRRA